MTACSGGESEAESTGTKHSSVVKNAKGEILAPEKRLWKNDLLGEEIALHSDIADSLFNPMNIKRFGNRLVISDFGDMRIKRFDLEGRYIDSFGSKGKGPGEFQGINDFDIRGEEMLYVIDGRNMRLMAFDIITTNFTTSYNTEPNPYRMVMLDEQLIIETLTAEKLFYKADLKGKASGWFGRLWKSNSKINRPYSAKWKPRTVTPVLFLHLTMPVTSTILTAAVIIRGLSGAPIAFHSRKPFGNSGEI